MKRFLAFFLILCFVAVLPAQQATSDQIAAIMADLSRITGLKLLKPIEQESMGRDELRDFFNKRIKELVKPEEIRAQELTLKKFGLVPPEFNLQKTTVDLMTEQAAAFYDYRRKKMVLLAGGNDMMQQVALVHELAHALADQHFNLEKYLDKGESSDDASMALQAVMEGQATWLMSEYMAQKMGQSLRDSPQLVQMMSRVAAESGGTFPVFDSVPLYMRESLLFPYVQGMQFQQAVTLKYGEDGFARVFRDPPQTTREIMHPEVYFSDWKPVDVKLPEIPNAKDWKKLADGTIGEFDHTILFRQYSKDDEPLAASLRGGNYCLWENKKDKRVVLAYASAWESPEKAKEAFAVWQRVQKGKWKNYEATDTTGSTVKGSGDDGDFILTLDDSVIRSIEGLPHS